MVPSTTRTLSGDLRPLWVVSGRIRSTYPMDLKKVRIKIVAYEKNQPDNILDTAEFDVENIPSSETKGFRVEIPLLVKHQEFEFKWFVENARIATVNDP